MTFVLDYPRIFKRTRFSEEPDKLTVVEIQPSHFSYELQKTQLPDADVGPWSTKNTLHETEAPAILRLVWVPMREESQGLILDTRKSSLDTILQKFELEEVYRYSFTYPALFALISARQTEQSNTPAFSLSMKDVFGFAWKHDVTSGRTEGLFWCYDWAYEEMWLIMNKTKAWVRHPLFLALIASVMLGDLLDTNLGLANRTINAVEARTRYHGFHTPPSEIAEDNFTSLSQRMSGCAVELAMTERDHKVLAEFLGEICLYSQRYDVSDDPSSRGVKSGVEDCVEALKRRLKIQKIELDLLSRRVEIQLTAVSNELFTTQLSILRPHAPH